MLVTECNYSYYLPYKELLEHCRKENFGKELKLGYSKEKREIIGFKIGEGEKIALIYGEPHAEELVGTLTVHYLLKELQHHEDLLKKWSFILIPTIDPDGLERNKRWIGRPFDPELFILNHYHRPDEQDIDWTFPIKTKNYKFSKPTKETKILMKLINQYKPTFYASLHNIHFAGIHFYATENKKELFDTITNFIKEKTSVPLQKGSTFFAEEDWQFQEGFYRIVGTRDQIKEISDKKELKNFRRGECGPLYYKSIVKSGFALVPEVPMLYSPELVNTEESTKTIKETMIKSNEIMLEAVEIVEKYWKKWRKKLNKKHHQYAKIKEIALNWKEEILTEMREIRANKEERIALKNEVFSNEIIVRYNNSLIFGQLAQLIANSSKIPKENKEQILEELKSEIKIRIKEAKKERVKIAELNELIKIQTFALMTTIKRMQ